MEGSSKILQGNIKLLLIKNKDSLSLNQSWGATDVRATGFWRRHELSILGNSFLWERMGRDRYLRPVRQLEPLVQMQKGASCQGALSEWVCPGMLRACLVFGVALAQTFSELLAKLGSVSFSSNSADGSSSPLLEPMWWFTLLNPFLAPNTPGSVWCG